MKRLIGIAFVTATLALTGCGNDDDSTDTTVAAAADTAAPVDSAAPDTAAAAPADTTPAAPADSAAAAPVDSAAAAAAADTTPAAPTDSAAAAATDTTAAAAAAGPAYVLAEFTVQGPASLPAGATELAITNNGKFPHEFIVLKGVTYEDAPKNALGTVEEAKLTGGASVLGEVEKVEPGTNAKLAVTLEPGTYTFLCNIEFGPTSHAGKGQHLTVTVA